MTIVAPPTQGTWRSNDYVSAFRLVDASFFYGVGGGAVYIHILGGRHKRARPRLPSYSHHIHYPNITFPRHTPNITFTGYLCSDNHKRDGNYQMNEWFG